jgi:hypothetical protein
MMESGTSDCFRPVCAPKGEAKFQPEINSKLTLALVSASYLKAVWLFIRN